MTGHFLTRPLAALLLLAGATSAGATEPLADPSRLVTIGGSITEIVYALGAGDQIVGRDTTSTYPPETAVKPDIGYMRQLSPEGVLSIDPSAIITIEGAGPPETMDVLKQAEVEMAVVPEDYSRDGILAKVEMVGALIGKEAEAEALAADIKQRLDPLLAANEARPEEERKSALFILSLNGGKVMASGTGTAANGMIEAAGLDNAVGDFPGYKALSDEAIIDAAPDVIILMDESAGSRAPTTDDIAANPALSLTPAGEAMAIYRIDPVGMLNFGPRFAENLAALTTEIYGD
ncbi:ABC transporter substrate-binding protein [Martelella mediterranea]|uniref:heme/hemin ABC transporter substrate-binding protein n=1 Tax=Martelella mediterranea TaxID=293089 RepID=UPI001E55BB7B|nr:ABC transporter substrate-binding protein [Martelella mediterranea]MCD1634658.1 ABC transporter substrate-binding protein [Martelella mediterranea]